MIQDSFFATLSTTSLDSGSRLSLKLQGEVTSLDVDFSPAPAILPTWLRRVFGPQAKIRLASISAGNPGVLEAWLAVAKLNWFRPDEKSVIIAWESPDVALEREVISDVRQFERFLGTPKAVLTDVPAPDLNLDDGKKPDLAGAGEAMRRISGQGSQRLEERPPDSDESSSVDAQAGLREIVFETQGAVPKQVKAFVLNDLGDILKVHVPPGQPLPSREYSIKKNLLI